MQDNPILRNFRNIVILFLYSISFAVVSFLILYFGLELDLYSSVVESLVSATILCGLTIIWHYPAKYISIEQFHLLKVFSSHVITAVFSSGLWILFIYIVRVCFLFVFISRCIFISNLFNYSILNSKIQIPTCCR